MRIGLVAVGAAFLAVACASAGALVLDPPPPNERVVTSDIPAVPSSPNQTREVLLQGANGSSATFSVHWQATSLFEVSLYRAPGCTTASLECVTGLALHTWTSNLSGTYASDGWVMFPYLLVWTDAGSGVASLQATATCSWYVGTGNWDWATVAEMVSAGVLGFVGAVILFLGIFVRGGLYRKNRAGDGSSSDPPGDPGPSTGPRTDSPGGGSEPPRRGPPARGP